MKKRPSNYLEFDFDTPTDEIVETVISDEKPIESNSIPIEPKPPGAVESKPGAVLDAGPGASEPAPECQHNPADLYSWKATDGVMVVCCKACKKILSGATPEPDEMQKQAPPLILQDPAPEPIKSIREISNDRAVRQAQYLLANNYPADDPGDRAALRGYTGTGGILNNQEAKGQYFTPYETCRFAMNAVNPNEAGAILDPTCGTGRFFEYHNPDLCTGIELQTDAAMIAKLLYPSAMIEQADILDNCHFREQFDYVFGNPPFGLWWKVNADKWNTSSAAGKILSQWATLEIAIKSVKTGGVVALVVPQNTFTNERAADQRAAAFWKSNCYIRAIFHLPKMTFKDSGTTWPCSVLIIQRPPCKDAPAFERTITASYNMDMALEEFHMADSYSAMKESEGLLVSARMVKKRPVRINMKFEKKKEEFKKFLDVDLSVETKEDFIVVQRKGHVLQLQPVGLIAALKLEQWKRDSSGYFEKWERFCTINRLIINGEVPGFTEYGLKMKLSPDLEMFLIGKRKLYARESTEVGAIHEEYGMLYQHKTNLLKSMGLWDNLFPYQRHDAVIHAIKHFSFLGYIQGLGKTRTAIASCMIKQCEKNLFICYSRLEKVWKDEMILMGIPESEIKVIKTVNDLFKIRKYNIVSFETLRKQSKTDPPVTCPICKSEVKGKICQGPVIRATRYELQDKKICGWNRFTDAACPKCGAVDEYTGRYCNKCGYAHIDWKPGIYKRMRNMFSCIIIDESQASKNKNSLQGQAVRALKAKHKMILTGTVLENYVSEAFFQFYWLLGGGSARFPYPWRGGHSMFTKQFCEFEHTRTGRKRMKPSIQNEKSFWKLLDGIMTRRTEKDASVKEVIQLPEANEVKIRLEPTEPEVALYTKVLDDFETWYIEQLETRAMLPDWKRGDYDKQLSAMVLVKLNYLRQISSCSFAFPDYTGNGTAKLKVIKQIIKEKTDEGKKVLISSAFKKLVFKIAEIPGVVQFTGDMAIKDRNEIMNEFQTKPDPNVLAVTTQCCNLGVTLTKATTAILCDYLWSPKQMEQMWKRVHRVGQKEEVDIIYLINQGFIDEDMDTLITQKDAAINKAIDRVTTATEGVYLSPMEFANKMLKNRGRGRWQNVWKG